MKKIIILRIFAFCSIWSVIFLLYRTLPGNWNFWVDLILSFFATFSFMWIERLKNWFLVPFNKQSTLTKEENKFTF